MKQASSLDRLVEVPEHDLVDAIFGDPFFIQHIGVPPQMSGSLSFRLRVNPAALGLSPDIFGDADAVLVKDGKHAFARAVEFKRVKISASGLSSGTVNKLPELRKAAHQANALHGAGFAFVWITVIVVADMRPITAGRGYAAPPLNLIEQVRQAIPAEGLSPQIGISICEIAQVSDRPVNERGSAGGHMLRAASEQIQPVSLTMALEKLFADSAAT